MNINKILYLLCLGFIFSLVFFSPFIANIISVIFMLLLCFDKNKKYHIFWIMVAIFSISNGLVLISAERFINGSDDFTSYYNAFLGMVNSDFERAIVFGPEFGVYTLNWLLSLFIINPTPYLYLFLMVEVQFLLLVFLTLKISRYYNLGSEKYILVFLC